MPALGYSINAWRQEIQFNRFRLDFLAETSQTLDPTKGVFFEAKHPNKHLNDHVDQLKRYMIDLQITYGLLTNKKKLNHFALTSCVSAISSNDRTTDCGRSTGGDKTDTITTNDDYRFKSKRTTILRRG
ncbi:MAG: hypothetical protein VSS75_031065 [Candidatus Parabeggiatoa sp.]|nr:hypothetical protein [Candidatus Parabeggiatoa sp.]